MYRSDITLLSVVACFTLNDTINSFFAASSTLRHEASNADDNEGGCAADFCEPQAGSVPSMEPCQPPNTTLRRLPSHAHPTSEHRCPWEMVTRFTRPCIASPASMTIHHALPTSANLLQPDVAHSNISNAVTAIVSAHACHLPASPSSLMPRSSGDFAGLQPGAAHTALRTHAPHFSRTVQRGQENLAHVGNRQGLTVGTVMLDGKPGDTDPVPEHVGQVSEAGHNHVQSDGQECFMPCIRVEDEPDSAAVWVLMSKSMGTAHQHLSRYILLLLHRSKQQQRFLC